MSKGGSHVTIPWDEQKLAIEAIQTDGLGEEIDDEFESTEERTHWKTEEMGAIKKD